MYGRLRSLASRGGKSFLYHDDTAFGCYVCVDRVRYVNLKGKCVAERAKAIIGPAHPDFREDLDRQAYEKR